VKKVLILTVGMLAGCSTAPLEDKYPKGLLICPREAVKICEGRNPQMLECECINRRALERQLQNIVLF
jgi:hypothetical protein